MESVACRATWVLCYDDPRTELSHSKLSRRRRIRREFRQELPSFTLVRPYPRIIVLSIIRSSSRSFIYLWSYALLALPVPWPPTPIPQFRSFTHSLVLVVADSIPMPYAHFLMPRNSMSYVYSLYRTRRHRIPRCL